MMEVNCRLSGDMIARLLELRSGLNTGALLLALAAGEAVEPPARFVGAAGVRMATVERGGTIRALRPPLVRHEREAAVFELGPGGRVHPPRPGGATRIGYYLAAADTADRVEARLAELAAETVVELDPS
jgi:biotin carboxylase